ncbi:MAG: ribose-phosphate pyrophosphokinase [Eubacteriales bacterium]|nr:ribose-phosphate pyrophosphokinase [Eubacteriales bacterium]MDY3332907.1 ribose-phosphate pyrophosphokinase [Gallibacter sp.]
MMNKVFGDFKVFTCDADNELAKAIAKEMGTTLSNAEVKSFSDGETSVSLGETVRGIDCFIIQSTCQPVNDNLMSILIMIDAMKRASAGRINVVMPYYGYARQDRKAKARDPITAKLVADLLEAAGADRVITMDLHAAQIQGYFDIPVDHLLGMPILAEYYLKENIEDLVIVSPDHGSVTRARKLAEPLHVPIAIIDKRRPAPNVSEVMNIIGDIKGKNCVLVDDMIDTAGTICNAAEALIKLGAKSVRAAATHAVLSGPAIERLNNSVLCELVFLDTIPMNKEADDRVKVLSVASLFAETLTRIHEGRSIGELFR